MLDNALQRAMTGVPDCLAAGFVDLTSGMILSIKTVDSHPSEVFDFLLLQLLIYFRDQMLLQLRKSSKNLVG
jgi:BarA-like signal transduction histidine kinase